MKRWMKRAPAFLLFAIAATIAFGAIVMVLWNGLMPAVFHLGTITLLQAVGLLLLSRILLGGFKGKGGRHCGHHRRDMARRWKNAGSQGFDNAAENVRQYTASWHMRYNPESAL